MEDSDPDVSERKVRTTLALVPASAAAAFSSVPPSVDRGGSIHDSASVVTEAGSVNTARGGALRSGKYASLNAQHQAKKRQDGDGGGIHEEEGRGKRRGKHGSATGPDGAWEEDDDDDDFNDVGTYESYYNDNGSDVDDDDDDEGTLNTIVTNTKNAQKRYDRSVTHFLRTTDLGLTQDTVFAQQFLEDPGMKAEPHFHHPSPHPPPGVQFNVSRGWCLTVFLFAHQYLSRPPPPLEYMTTHW